ncbi:ER membrane protein complex subunit 4, partial [Alligator sinensis]|uniref:ER membrane protein complex subunit 4 n=1 Tax=Alligator sinensis TaxID=38654 RepID=A0A1U7RS20_ALLSI
RGRGISLLTWRGKRRVLLHPYLYRVPLIQKLWRDFLSLKKRLRTTVVGLSVFSLLPRGRSDRGSSQGDSLYPVGYSDKQVPDTSVQETDRILVEKRCWDIALGPLKQIPMNLFIMYMAGNTISIFPTMMVCMMAWRPLQALMAISATFKLLESSSQKFLQGLVYLVGNLLGLALAVYKCQSMGLLPTHASDWLAFIEPPERMEYTGGGLLL